MPRLPGMVFVSFVRAASGRLPTVPKAKKARHEEAAKGKLGAGGISDT